MNNQEIINTNFRRAHVVLQIEHAAIDAAYWGCDKANFLRMCEEAYDINTEHLKKGTYPTATEE